MLDNKGFKAFPVGDFMPTALLEVRNSSAISGLLFAFDPEVERIATDMEHLTDIGFPFSALDRSNGFTAQVFTVRSRHWQVSITLSTPYYKS
jgi:hypothetical protein